MSTEFWDSVDGRNDPVGFTRHPTTGAPFVDSPTEITKAGNTKRVMYGRPSSAYGQIDNRHNLEKWSERMVGIGIATLMMNGELLSDDLDVIRNYDPDDKDARAYVDSLVVKAKTEAGAMLAAESGTQRHLLTENLDLEVDPVHAIQQGTDLGIPEEVSLAVMWAWRDLLEYHGIEILNVEAPVVDDEFRLAGTLDRIGRLCRDITLPIEGGEITLPAGLVLVVDIKTGKLTVDRHGRIDHWHGYALQIASYARGRLYGFEPEGRRRWPRRPSRDHGVIVHIDATDERVEARLVYVNLRAGLDGLRIMRAAKQFAKRRDVIGLAGIADVSVKVP